MYCSCAAQRTLKLQTTDLGAEALVLAGAGREAGPLGGAAPAHRVDRGPQDAWAVGREGSGKLDWARSRLYRGQIWQENMRLKALAEISTQCTPLHSSAFSNFVSFFQ